MLMWLCCTTTWSLLLKEAGYFPGMPPIDQQHHWASCMSGELLSIAGTKCIQHQPCNSIASDDCRWRSVHLQQGNQLPAQPCAACCTTCDGTFRLQAQTFANANCLWSWTDIPGATGVACFEQYHVLHTIWHQMHIKTVMWRCACILRTADLSMLACTFIRHR